MASKFLGPEELKKLFPVLRWQDDFVLVPLMNTVCERFQKYLFQDPPPDWVTERMITSSGYFVIIGGRSVVIRELKEDIDVMDEDEWWWMTKGLSLQGTSEPSEAVDKFCEKFRDFLGQQELAALIEETAGELKKGKIYHLAPDMRDAYFSGVL